MLITGLEKDFEEWKNNVLNSIIKLFELSNDATNKFKSTKPQETTVCCSETGSHVEHGNESSSSEEDNDDVLDLEDIGGVMKKGEQPATSPSREMVTPLIKQSLTKQGKC